MDEEKNKQDDSPNFHQQQPISHILTWQAEARAQHQQQYAAQGPPPPYALQVPPQQCTRHDYCHQQHQTYQPMMYGGPGYGQPPQAPSTSATPGYFSPPGMAPSTHYYSGNRCCSHVAKSTTPGSKRRAAEMTLGSSSRMLPSPVPAPPPAPASGSCPIYTSNANASLETVRMLVTGMTAKLAELERGQEHRFNAIMEEQRAIAIKVDSIGQQVGDVLTQVVGWESRKKKKKNESAAEEEEEEEEEVRNALGAITAELKVLHSDVAAGPQVHGRPTTTGLSGLGSMLPPTVQEQQPFGVPHGLPSYAN